MERIDFIDFVFEYLYDCIFDYGRYTEHNYSVVGYINDVPVCIMHNGHKLSVKSFDGSDNTDLCERLIYRVREGLASDGWELVVENPKCGKMVFRPL